MNHLSKSAVLDRRHAISRVVGDHRDFLIIGGLAGPAQDIAHMTNEAPHTFILGGAMGGACMMGYGLALALPDRRVLVVTGDGDLLMSLGSLATIGAGAPSNLSILCVDNERYGETGNQRTHTSMGVDLRKAAEACGMVRAIEVVNEDEIESASVRLRESGPNFVLLKVGPGPSSRYSRNFDAVERKIVFKSGLAAGSRELA